MNLQGRRVTRPVDVPPPTSARPVASLLRPYVGEGER